MPASTPSASVGLRRASAARSCAAALSAARCSCCSSGRTRACAFHDRLGGAARRRPPVRPARRSSPDIAGFDGRVERAIQQQVQRALGLRAALIGLDALLRGGQQFGAGAQHRVLGDLAVGIQRLVDAQVLAQDVHAAGDDAGRRAGLLCQQVGARDVAPLRALQCVGAELRGLGAGAAGRDAVQQAGRIERLAQRQVRVLLVRAQQRETGRRQHAEARRLAHRHQQFIQRLVGRVQQLIDGHGDLAAAAVHRVARVQAQLRAAAAPARRAAPARLVWLPCAGWPARGWRRCRAARSRR